MFFGLNPGNHFQDVEQRIAKGVAWIVSDTAKGGSSSMTVRRHIIFSGQVQGVGFRYTATHLSRPLDLTGWVKNLWDGRVEMEVQGRPEAIEQLLSQLRNHRYILIEDVEIQEMPVVEETGFVTKGY